MRGFAELGKSSKGWFFGFKLHLTCNRHGELCACKITRGHVDDRSPVATMTHHMQGKLFGDKGYISADLTQQLLQRGLLLDVNYLCR